MQTIGADSEDLHGNGTRLKEELQRRDIDAQCGEKENVELHCDVVTIFDASFSVWGLDNVIAVQCARNVELSKRSNEPQM